MKRGREKGYRCSPVTRAKMSAAGLGRSVSDETRAKLSAAHRGKPWSAKRRQWCLQNWQLPPMSLDEHRLYRKLQPIVGREATLVEIRRGQP